jgi:hypothetical protein
VDRISKSLGVTRYSSSDIVIFKGSDITALGGEGSFSGRPVTVGQGLDSGAQAPATITKEKALAADRAALCATRTLALIITILQSLL